MWASPPGFEGKMPGAKERRKKRAKVRRLRPFCPTQLAGAVKKLHPAQMPLTASELLASAPFLLATAVVTFTIISCSFTWWASRAKKVRIVEDELMEHVRLQKLRADQVDTKLGEWQVTITSILGEVEEFFERTVKERQRIAQQNKRAEQAQAPPVDPLAQDIRSLPRAQQIALVHEHFNKQGH